MAENPRIEELRRRVQSDPASIAFAALAEEFRRMGRHEEAIETCRAGLQRHPAYLSARVTLGRALIETGEYEAARAELETVLRAAPENLAAIRGLAQIHERLGQSTEMDPHFAAMMNAEVERAALAAAAPPPSPPAPPAPEPIAVAALVTEPVAIAEPEVAVSEPMAVVEPTIAPEPALGVEPMSVAVPMIVAEPVIAAGPSIVVEPIRLAEPELIVPTFEPETEEPGISQDDEIRLLFPPVATGPDPAMLAILARLERFLVAIDAARHP